MKKNGIEGAATCAEVVGPYYGPFAVGAIKRLEAAIIANKSAQEIGGALAGYYRISDSAGSQVDFDEAPTDVQGLDLCLRDAAITLIERAGGNPDDYNVMPDYLGESSARL